MNRIASLLSASLLALGACAIDSPDVDSVNQADTGELGLAGAPEPHMMNQRGAKTAGPPAAKDVHLKNKGPGVVLSAPRTKAIFWGPKWTDGSAFAGDKVSGLDSFFAHIGGSAFANTNTEYDGPIGTFAGNAIAYDGQAFDGSPAPTKALSVSGAVSEACKIATANGGAPDPNTVYFIYTETTAGHVSYCAWHSAGTCNGVTIQVAYMPDIGGLAGCDPLGSAGNEVDAAGHSEPLAALANVTAHELSEAITDPHLDAWQDSGGQENADKCAWHWGNYVSFVTSSTDNGDGTFTTTTEQWKLQMNFSNHAYDANYTDDLSTTNPLRGCIQSKSAPFSTTPW